MDFVDVQILADGTVKSTNGEVSPENHQSAEGFFKMLAGLTGGEAKRTPRGDAARHQVDHQHQAHHHHDH